MSVDSVTLVSVDSDPSNNQALIASILDILSQQQAMTHETMSSEAPSDEHSSDEDEDPTRVLSDEEKTARVAELCRQSAYWTQRNVQLMVEASQSLQESLETEIPNFPTSQQPQIHKERLEGFYSESQWGLHDILQSQDYIQHLMRNSEKPNCTRSDLPSYRDWFPKDRRTTTIITGRRGGRVSNVVARLRGIRKAGRQWVERSMGSG